MDWISTASVFAVFPSEINFFKKIGRKISIYERELIEGVPTDKFNYPDNYKNNPYQYSYIQIVNESYYEHHDTGK